MVSQDGRDLVINSEQYSKLKEVVYKILAEDY